MVDSSRWELDNRSLWRSAGGEPAEYISMYPLRRDVETCGESFTMVRVGSVPVPSTTDAVDLVLPLGGDRLTTKQLPVGDNAITVRWCYGLREMLPLARQMPELCVGSVSNLCTSSCCSRSYCRRRQSASSRSLCSRSVLASASIVVAPAGTVSSPRVWSSSSRSGASQ